MNLLFIKKILAHYTVVFVLLVVLLFGGIFAVSFVRNAKKASENKSVNIKKVELLNVSDYSRAKKEILTSGTVESFSQADIRSQANAPVERVGVIVGQSVAAGQILVSLKNADISAQLQQAEAGLKAQESRLAEMRKGFRSEEIAITETETQRAGQDLATSYRNAVNTLNDAFVKADDAVRKQADPLFSDDEGPMPGLTFSTNDASAEVALRGARVSARLALTEWKKDIDALSPDSSPEVIDSALIKAQKHLDVVRDLLNKAGDILRIASGIQDDALNGYKASLGGARASVAGVISAVNGQRQMIESQKLTVKRMTEELGLKKSGLLPEQIAAQEALVDSARAGADVLKEQYSKTIIRSPIAGKVSAVSVKAGDLLSFGQPVVSVVNSDGLKVKAFISGVDATLISFGAKAKISDSIDGIVSEISPSVDPQTRKVETIILLQKGTSSSPLVGQFAEIKILPNRNIDATRQVFVLPLSAVEITNDGAFVFVISSDKTALRLRVETGEVMGESVEIVSGISPDGKIIAVARGLREGDEVTAE